MTTIGQLPAVRSGLDHGVEWRLLLCPFGNFVNGYARIPDGHPWRALGSYLQVPADVHGGLTYGGDDWWIGFDTGHAFDVWTDEALAEAGGKTTGWELQLDGDPFNRLWTLDAVEAEVRDLAHQIALAAGEQPTPGTVPGPTAETAPAATSGGTQ